MARINPRSHTTLKSRMVEYANCVRLVDTGYFKRSASAQMPKSLQRPWTSANQHASDVDQSTVENRIPFHLAWSTSAGDSRNREGAVELKQDADSIRTIHEILPLDDEDILKIPRARLVAIIQDLEEYSKQFL